MSQRFYRVWSNCEHGTLVQKRASLDHSLAVLSLDSSGEALPEDLGLKSSMEISKESETVSDEFDLSVAVSPFCVISKKAYGYLGDLIRKDVQFLEINVSGTDKKFIGVHVLKRYGLEVVDEDKSKLNYFGDNFLIYKLVLKSGFESDSNIFCIAGYAGVFVTEVLKNRVAECGLNSFIFKKLKSG